METLKALLKFHVKVTKIIIKYIEKSRTDTNVC